MRQINFTLTILDCTEVEDNATEAEVFEAICERMRELDIDAGLVADIEYD